MTGLKATMEQADRGGPPGDDPLHNPLLSAFGLLHETHFGALTRLQKDLDSSGLTISTFEVLLRLSRSPGQRLRMAELTAQCTITSSGLTRVIDRMTASGHVVREPCESDRRGFYAVITPQGLDELMKVLPEHVAALEAIWSVLDPAEMDAFVASLRKLRAAVAPCSDPEVSSTDMSDRVAR